MKKKDIEFLDVVALRGPNIWTYRPVLEAWVDIGELEDYPSNTIPGFYERLTEWLPTLIEHRCSPGVRGGFLARVKEGTWPGHILEHVTLELQNLAGLRGGFGKARETSTRGVYKVVVRAWQEQVTRAALNEARDLVMAAIEDRPFDVPATISKLRSLIDRHCLGPSTACIVDAADDRDIPYIRLFEGNLVQFGYGSAQRRIWTAETDRTSAIAEGISRDKDLTKELLSTCGVPVPEGRLVDSEDDAWDAAEDIGLPVVVKPYDGNHGRGVFTNLTTREEVVSAYRVAVDEGSGVIVERFVLGNEHRLLVVGDRMVAAAAGEPAWVTGDGKSTITELIDSQINTDPRRGRTENHPLNPVRLDSAARLEIARQGLTEDGVPAEGQRVLVQRSGNVAFDVTDRVHPSVAATVTLAARIVGLDIAGVDLVAEDISRPLEEQRGAIVEVNAGPGLLMHLKPADGTPRPVGRAIVDHLFPDGDAGRIPIVGVTGTNGKTVVARLVARLLHLSGKRTGLACSEGLYLDRRLVQKGDRADFDSGTRLLMNRNLDAAVIENDSGVILGQGLAYDRCQVGVVTNIDDADHLGDFDINETERMFNVFRTQVDVVLPTGAAVLNARDPRVVEMAELCDGAVIFFGIDPALPAIAEHLGKDGRAVFVRDGAIVLAQGAREESLAAVAAIPLTHGGRVAFQVENVLAAVGAAWALDIPVELIRAGIETFDIDQADAPWQFTLFERNGSTVVVDDVHNASALRPLIAAIDQFPSTLRAAVYSAGADRRDEDLIEQGRLLGDAFDRVVLYDDLTVRSKRPAGQARALLRQGLAQGSRVKDIQDEPDHGKAIESQLNGIAAGDFVLLQSDEAFSGPTIDLVRRWIQQY
ncbi:cyanophycin synthetase [Achromobacter denitrificans]|jgi:cyanophycin synthetase|uniref:cyanophycin synthetase n=1 Tax=Achromobacter denitrificans TaxID=32002 RepID=UPI000B4C7085|nr:cyanophycin synthetase [Achromobacter denitrificans]ASC63183.1 cyanophycin synthetase [Achromobacter denitrificans]MDF3941123.1 cyanophycin synthetase [Achromobacter denitrificans]QCS61546.1 cyanophycin synthetase [Achromobacter denitrificans]RSE79316.1 cyanophycin synthetase [Achromobacter denitrificans]CAB3892387.1 Cyanophycin synthetase [Achromobacter denitrificans]